MAEKNYVQLKLGVLSHLRDLFHRQALTNEVLTLGLTLVAADLGVREEDVQSTIAELVALGLAQPTSHAHLAAAQGEVEITKEGLSTLHNYEFAVHLPPSESSLRPVGFDTNADDPV